MIRTSLSRAPSGMTAEQRADHLAKREAEAWHKSGAVLVRTTDPRVPAHLRMAAEAWGFSRFGRRKAPAGGSQDD